ncbi:MAG TPA: class A beta-lactamase, partial [Roseiarcus sp.]|nr:class A beta-lactamase [Roseiarcus sp.]
MTTRRRFASTAAAAFLLAGAVARTGRAAGDAAKGLSDEFAKIESASEGRLGVAVLDGDGSVLAMWR